MSLTALAPWRQLEKLQPTVSKYHLRDLFAADPLRFQRFSLSHGEILVDFSKQRITQEVWNTLLALAQARDVSGWWAKMQAGEQINHTEERAALHTALRAQANALYPYQGKNVVPAIQATLDKMASLCAAVHAGDWHGYDGSPIRDVVNIGIGGSDLGPRMAVKALSACRIPCIRVHFVSNIDGADLAPVLQQITPGNTLFIITSKTFTTAETLQNARTARDWLFAAGADQASIARHFVAVSANREAACAFGIDADNVLNFWDWVGGRFSIWSAVGLPLALSIGFANFRELLAGARNMDEHFASAPAERNLPLALALVSLWNTNFLHATTQAVLPYSQSLEYLPAYLQQLFMESNGKQTGRDGRPIGVATAPVLWGATGTNSQHSFFQLIHQGGRLVPCEFIALRQADYPLTGHHSALLANCLAQSAALAFGQTADEVAAQGGESALIPHKVLPGNQPSTTLLLDQLNPRTLGMLLALYEHKVFALATLWGINAFDQWGVERGKTLANRLLPCLENPQTPCQDIGDELDASTRGLLQALRKNHD